jgi:hypothetical protein
MASDFINLLVEENLEKYAFGCVSGAWNPGLIDINIIG